MEEFRVSICKTDGGEWCVQETGDPRVYVYGTKRSAMNAAERMLNLYYGIKAQQAAEESNE